jgi:hypothetical protein
VFAEQLELCGAYPIETGEGAHGEEKPIPVLVRSWFAASLPPADGPAVRGVRIAFILSECVHSGLPDIRSWIDIAQ